jgi:hypothetical protein
MLILGLLLIAATAAFTGLVIADNLSGGPKYTASVLGQDIATMNTLAVFCSGLALALLFCLGLALVTTRRRHRPRTHEPRHALRVRRSGGSGHADLNAGR